MIYGKKIHHSNNENVQNEENIVRFIMRFV